MGTDIENPAQYQNTQTFEINIDQIYSDWITPIDNIRSFTSISGTQSVFHDLANKKIDIAGVARHTKMEKTVQESRCHAFYRMLGLPIVGKSDGTNAVFYNSGFDIIKCLGRSITIGDKIAIINNPIPGFYKLSEKRELFSQSNLEYFSNPNNIRAGVLALSSGGTESLRRFIAPLEKNSTVTLTEKDMEVESYRVNIVSRVGKNPIELSDYQDSNGTKVSSDGTFVSNTLLNRTHIIAPFIVDARIDLTVSPQSRLVAIPFVYNESYTKVSATESVVRPVIEKIIRDRFAPIDASTAGSNITDSMNYVKNNPAISDQVLVKKISDKDLYNQKDQNIFVNSVKTIETMMARLVIAEKAIGPVQEKFYWVPLSSTSGPEGGVTVQPVFNPAKMDSKLVTDSDREILETIIKSKIANLNTESADKPSFPIPTVDFGSTTASGLGDNNKTNKETLLQIRTRTLTIASNALRTVEIIMGEFSGLGLCDIVAITSALNIMDKSKLLGLLDEKSYERFLKIMKLDGPVQTTGVSAATTTTRPTRHPIIIDCLQELTDRVKDYYNLMDKIYFDTKNKTNSH